MRPFPIVRSGLDRNPVKVVLPGADRWRHEHRARVPAVPICISYIAIGRFVDVKTASAHYRLLGDEARLRLLRLLWSTTKPVDFHGKFFNLENAVLGLEPYEVSTG